VKWSKTVFENFLVQVSFSAHFSTPCPQFWTKIDEIFCQKFGRTVSLRCNSQIGNKT
jgi:hypothetical protein